MNILFNIETFDVLLPLALILLLSKLLQLGCKKIKAPAVIGMLVAGLLIGLLKYTPLGNTILSESALSGLKFIAEIGVILIMFNAGLGTSIKDLRKTGLQAILATIGGVIVPLGLGFLVASIFNGFTGTREIVINGVTKEINIVFSNLFYGVILTATSVSVTVAALKELGFLHGKAGTIIVSAAILDDIIGVVLLSIILSLSVGSTGGSSTIGSLITNGPILSVVLDIVFFFIFTIILSVLMHSLFKMFNVKFAHTRRVPIFGLALCFFMAWASEKWFGVADITGAYFAGLALAGIGHKINNPKLEALTDDTTNYIERKNEVLSYLIFSPVFFANIGINTDFSGFSSQMVLFGSLFIVAAILGKVLGCGSAILLTKGNIKDAFRVGVGMMVRAEVALICTNKGIESGLVNPGIAPFVVILIVLTSLVTPLLLKISYKNEQLIPQTIN